MGGLDGVQALTRVLVVDKSLQDIMDTVETGTFIPDD